MKIVLLTITLLFFTGCFYTNNSIHNIDISKLKIGDCYRLHKLEEHSSCGNVKLYNIDETDQPIWVEFKFECFDKNRELSIMFSFLGEALDKDFFERTFEKIPCKE